MPNKKTVTSNNPIHVDREELTAGSLCDHFLIAMPDLKDPNIARTVTYICEHNEEGAMGITINHPLELTVSDIFEQFKLSQDADCSQQQVLSGGPVQVERGFVIHPQGPSWESTLQVSNEISISSSRDILEDMAAGDGPEHNIVALGYAGWGPGQLEAEIADNAWLTVPADSNLLFHTPCELRWAGAAQKLGVNLDLIPSGAGHA